MKYKITLMVVAALVLAVFGGMAEPAFAANCKTAAECINTGVNATGTTGGSTSVGDILKTVVNVLLFVLGAAAVIMIVIGGIRYTTSNGDAGAVKGAKDTILYSIIGLIVALMAYAIVNWVVTAFVK